MTEVVKLISTYVKIESVLMNLKFQAVDFIHFCKRNLTFGNVVPFKAIEAPA